MSYSGIEYFFLVCAIVGGICVLARFILQFIGMGHDGCGDMDVSGHDGIDAHHADSDAGFKALSLHGITSFLMMFGLVGLALFRQSRMGMTVSLIGACIAGTLSVWIIGKLFSFAARLKSTGTIDIDSAVGAQGKVYLNIPENGTGRALVSVHGSLREYDAMSNNSQGIPTGDAIRVVWVDGNVLVVEKI